MSPFANNVLSIRSDETGNNCKFDIPGMATCSFVFVVRARAGQPLSTAHLCRSFRTFTRHMFRELVTLCPSTYGEHAMNAPCVDVRVRWINDCFLLSLLDHPKPFEIEPSTAVAGDDITLTCRGTRLLYDRLNWYDPLGRRVPRSETVLRIEPYSVSLSVKLPNVSRNHTLGYECQAFNINSNKVVNTTSVLTIDGEWFGIFVL